MELNDATLVVNSTLTIPFQARTLFSNANKNQQTKPGDFFEMSIVAAAAATAGVLLPLLQSQWQHTRTQRSASRFFQEEIEQRERHHSERVRDSRLRFRAEQDHETLQDLVRYRVRLALNRRQVARDIWFQRFLMNQTVIVIVGLLLGCCFVNLGQGAVPVIDTVHPASLYLHGSTLGIALASLSSSLWCSLKYLHRLNNFHHGDPDRCVYVCGKTHATFNDFFDCHCEPLRWWSVFLLGIGLVAVLTCGAVYVSMTMLRDDAVGLSLLGGILLGAILSVVLLEQLVTDDTVLRSSAVGSPPPKKAPTERKQRRSGEMRRRHEPAEQAGGELPATGIAGEGGDYGGLRGAADAENAIVQLLRDRALSNAVIRAYQQDQRETESR